MICTRCKKYPAVFFITRVDGDKTANEGLCVKCAMELNIGPVKQIMENMGISEEEMQSVSEQIEELYENGDMDEMFEPGGAGTFPFLQNMQGMFGQPNAQNNGEENKSGETKEKVKKPKQKNEKKRKSINLFCTDLTQNARDGKLDRIIGRDEEIKRTIQILCRRTKNNPCFIGEPGVGKTAIAEGLALKIAAGDVPAKLANKEIQLLDLTALVAGTQFRGQFESRIKSLVDEVKEAGNIILFIDEVHNLVGTGDAEGSMNAANILKPALSRGEIQVIGATTFNEYRKHIEKDAALERRFQPVKVEEPSIDDTYKMLLGIKSYYEDFHKVSISDNLVYKAVTLSERYITDRFLPDKAIDLLDEACTCANLRNKAISDYELHIERKQELEQTLEELEQEVENPDYEAMSKVRSEIISLDKETEGLKEKAADNNVTENDLATVINLLTGIPMSKVLDGDLKSLIGLEDRLKAKVIGQDRAVELVSAAIKRSRVQISAQRKPASFIFVGPTGVGKTELVKRLSLELFDTPETLIRLDMSEFMEKHSVSRIIGSPPGYVGYDEAGQLTEKVRRKPYSIILFDEIEKAHPDVMNILLQILDEGKTSDAHGRTVDFSNTVIIMTSNAGSERKENALGFAKDKAEVNVEKSIKALNEFLRPEFVGRVDEIVVFNELTEENYEQIATLMLNELGDALKDKGIKLNIGENVAKTLVSKMDGNIRGARDLRNVIRRNVEDKVSNYLVENSDRILSSVSLESVDNEIKVSVD
ncbi:MAG: ATP-dependent Clp protease ATP-binding subunit [Ruminococcaceae bacterium]|nr:ATP-dependent Clp protease ATP-binding subunit [Oscillospiraceae bacterium]